MLECSVCGSDNICILEFKHIFRCINCRASGFYCGGLQMHINSQLWQYRNN